MYPQLRAVEEAAESVVSVFVTRQLAPSGLFQNSLGEYPKFFSGSATGSHSTLRLECVWTQKVDDTQTAAEAEADSGTAAAEAPEEAVTATADSAKDDTARTGDTPAYAEYDPALRPYSITGYVLADITPDSELYYPLHYFNMAYAMRDELIVIAVTAAALAVLMFVFLMASAGRRAPEGIVTPAWTEKIPFDVFTVVIAVLVVMCVTAGANLALETAPDAVTLTLAAALAVCAMALALWWCMSYAVRLKLHAVIKSCVCYKLLAWLWRGVKKLFGYAAYIFRCIPFVPRAVLIMLGVLLVEFIFIASVGSTSSHLTGWFFERALLAAGVIVAVIWEKMNSVAIKVTANSYVSGTLQLTEQTDRFTHRTTSTRRIERSSSSGSSSQSESGGGGSGRSGKF